jgi:hypothetical protein
MLPVHVGSEGGSQWPYINEKTAQTGISAINTTARYLTITKAYKNQAIELFTVAENESNIIDLSRAAG